MRTIWDGEVVKLDLDRKSLSYVPDFIFNAEEIRFYPRTIFLVTPQCAKNWAADPKRFKEFLKKEGV